LDAATELRAAAPAVLRLKERVPSKQILLGLRPRTC